MNSCQLESFQQDSCWGAICEDLQPERERLSWVSAITEALALADRFLEVIPGNRYSLRKKFPRAKRPEKT